MQPQLEIIDLRVCVPADDADIAVVDGVSLTIPQGKIVALVGESGCGKSMTALSILRLLPTLAKIVSGRILWHVHCQSRSEALQSTATPVSSSRPSPAATSPYRHITTSPHPTEAITSEPNADSVNLLQLDERSMRRYRGGRIAMIFQEPMTALNPVFSIGEQIVEAVELHQPLRGKAARAEAVELLQRVGVADAHRRVRDYPHQFSGGMRQRAMIAMALACKPSLLIADEPTTALDVTIQAQILDLLQCLQAETGMSVLLITHDLGVVARIADEVHVMYAGRIVERAATGELFAGPLHPYTRGLLRCTPRLDDRKGRLEVISGSVPDPSRFPSGCRFHPRCDLSAERASDTTRHAKTIDSDDRLRVLRRCVESFDAEPSGPPQLREAKPNHQVACWEVK